jgi:hypothetical protein
MKAAKEACMPTAADLKRLKKIVTSDKRARELDEFSSSARTLASLEPTLADGQWVAMFAGRLVARAPTLETLLGELGKEKIPATRTVVRFIAKDEVIV